MWKGDVRYTATAEATILPAPPPVAATPNLVQTSGSQQGAADGTVKNGSVVGEGMLATTSKDPTGAFQVRHGFTPPVPTQKM
jgi:hypothetical protein